MLEKIVHDRLCGQQQNSCILIRRLCHTEVTFVDRIRHQGFLIKFITKFKKRHCHCILIRTLKYNQVCQTINRDKLHPAIKVCEKKKVLQILHVEYILMRN